MNKDFFHKLYMHCDDSELINFVRMRDKRLRGDFISVQEVITGNVTLEAGYDQYFGVCTGNRTDSDRYKAEDITNVPAFFLDIDLQGSKKADDKQPADEYALEKLDEFCQLVGPYSLLVQSGEVEGRPSGYHAYWTFSEPQGKESANTVRQFLSLFEQIAGFPVDHVADLARILRVPDTLNMKRDPPGKCRLISATANTVHFEEVAEILAGYDLPTAPKKATSIGTSSIGELDDNLLSALLLDHNFQATWKGKRNFDDDSGSTYCFAIATMMIQADIADEKIAPVMLAWRKIHTPDDLKLDRRDDWYARTIANAHARIDNPKTADDTAAEDPEEESSWVTSKLQVQIVSVEQHGSSDSAYRLTLRHGGKTYEDIDIGSASQITNQRHVKTTIFEVCGFSFPGMKAAQWDRVCNYIGSIRQVHEYDEMRSREMLESWLAEYTSGTMPKPAALSTGAAFVDEGILHVTGNHFHRWLKEGTARNLKGTQLRALLKGAGFEECRVDSESGKIRYWRRKND